MLGPTNSVIYNETINYYSPPALHKNGVKLRVESSGDCQGFVEGGEEFGDFLICADGKRENAARLGEPSGSVDDVSADCADVMEGPELDALECGIALFVGGGHLELAA